MAVGHRLEGEVASGVGNTSRSTSQRAKLTDIRLIVLVMVSGLLIAGCSDPVCEGTEVSECSPDDCTYLNGECVLRCTDGEGDEVVDCPQGTTCQEIPDPEPESVETPDNIRVCL